MFLPLAVSGGADLVRKVDLSLSAGENRSHPGDTAGVRDALEGILQAYAYLLLVPGGLGRRVERPYPVAARRGHLTAVKHVRDARHEVLHHCVARHSLLRYGGVQRDERGRRRL